MEEEPATPPTPASPFWLSSRTTRRNPLLSTGLHVALLSIVAIVLMAVVTPSLLSQAHQFFRPSSIKRGWDSINLVLVAFAIVCGFLGRKDDAEGSKDRSPISGQQYNWHSYGDEVRSSSLRRASSSYPDLIRQDMMWDAECDRRPRYYDDSYYVTQYNKSPTSIEVEGFRSQSGYGYGDAKVSEVDHSVRMKATKESPRPPPAGVGSRQVYEGVGRRVRRDGQGRRELEGQSPPHPAPGSTASSFIPTPKESPEAAWGGASTQKYQSSGREVTSDGQGRRNQSPPPEPSCSVSTGARTASTQEYEMTLESREAQPAQPPSPPEISQRKRGGPTKDKITSIYQQSKGKKKQSRRSHDNNLEDLIQTSNPNPLFPPPSPPPPPPPPPPSFFHNIFSSKKGKSSKKTPPLPPPPPPPRRQRRPPPPANPKKFDPIIDQMGGNGSESPSIPIPPPPPPPPFKVPSWKFVVQGDYVKITGSPLRDDDSGANTPTAAGSTLSPLFFPSPDVNLKADDFIARFRAKLKLEKMNSIKHSASAGDIRN